MSTYLDWVIRNTRTQWWHDSMAAGELETGLRRGAVGITTNPVLASAAMRTERPHWNDAIEEVCACGLPPEEKAEALMRIGVMNAAWEMLPRFEASGGKEGIVCAQVNPLRAGDRQAMRVMADRLHSWSPNISVKLPATAAGMDVLEDCVADGISVTATVSFTLPQLIASAERHRAGSARARARGVEPGTCFAVLMIGRLDDYLREIAQDNRAEVSEADIRQAGLAVAKRAYSLYRERGYEAVLLVAALRGDYHLTELAGADLVMSIHPAYQEGFVTKDYPRQERIECPIAADVIARLETIPEFVRAFREDGLQPHEFIVYGATQRTLSQFCEVGWKPLESFR